MKNNKSHANKKLNSKSAFYIALTICLAVAGTASYLLPKIVSEKNTPDTTQNTTAPVTQKVDPADLTQVNQNVEGIPDERYTETTTETTTTKPAIERAASFSLPLGTEILKDYSAGELVLSSTTKDWRVHSGVDFKGTIGDPIKAINNGIVTKVSDNTLWGTVVEIDHGEGLIARYCGLGKGSTVSEGDKVNINDKIGNLGEIPIEEADGPHLHLEIYQDGVLTDPFTAMGKTSDNLSE